MHGGRSSLEAGSSGSRVRCTCSELGSCDAHRSGFTNWERRICFVWECRHNGCVCQRARQFAFSAASATGHAARPVIATLDQAYSSFAINAPVGRAVCLELSPVSSGAHGVRRPGALLSRADAGYEAVWKQAGIDIDGAMGVHASSDADGQREKPFAVREGYLLLQRSEAAMKASEAGAALRSRHVANLRMEALSSDEVAELEPALAPSCRVGGAWFFPDGWFLNEPGALAARARVRFRRRRRRAQHRRGRLTDRTVVGRRRVRGAGGRDADRGGRGGCRRRSAQRRSRLRLARRVLSA